MTIRILAGGSVAADQGGGGAAVRIDGYDSEVLNEGSISGGYGVLIGGNGAGENQVVNTGTISGDFYAVRHFSGTTDTLVVKNYGSILGLGQSAYSFSSSVATIATDIVVNRGLMSGKVETGGGADILDNRDGRVDGDVYLGPDNDSLDNRGGTIVGTVFGEAGSDTFIGNATQADVFDGGMERDWLDFRTRDAVILALDDDFDPGGAALGDTYTSFENIQGSRFGADNLRGNGDANSLYGIGGNDTLNGAGGADFLRGGNGADTLTGGAGNDTFAFMTLNEIGDVITDFSSTGVGNDDRFIFRTTDKTLWFDVDGNAAAAAVMVADLQAGASMTSLDIVLV